MREKIIIVYELRHLKEIEEYLQSNKERVRIIALNFWVERELQKKNIVCESWEKWRLTDSEREEWLLRAGDIAREWYRQPQMSFFVHQDIRLGEASEPAIEAYLQDLLYFFVPLQKILSSCDEVVSVVVPHRRVHVSASAGSFAQFESKGVVDAVRFLARHKGFNVEELGPAPTGKAMPFPAQPFTSTFLLFWNFLARTFLPHKKLALFASENWYHIAPFLENMDDVELVLMDRNEIRHIPWRQILKHRIRFVHPLDIQTKNMRRCAAKKQKDFKNAWHTAKEAVGLMSQFTYNDIHWWPLVEPAFTFFVEVYVERLVYDIDALKHIYVKERIQKVLLRASVSGHQHHFFMAAKIASRMNLPSIELQHAGAVLDPRSVHSRMEASYLAGYGTLTQKLYSRNQGYYPDQIRAIGSPRFDRYVGTTALTTKDRALYIKEIGLDPKRPVVLIGAPEDHNMLIPHAFDSYENANFFVTLAQVQKKLPDLQVLFKFRSPHGLALRAEYIDTLFEGKNYAIVSDDLFTRIQMSDVVLSSNSTVMYETMIAQKPLVLFHWRKTDSYAIDVYTQAAPIFFSQDELVMELERILSDGQYAQQLVKKSNTFLKQNYSFDGQASQRTADLLREDLKVY